ncbi:MAG: hypothetical protein HY769_09670 [Candidatus Stahlbacteria bacterium]|nr:hypothetical protein [Candidatus Stahlbacteria bacterium]
MRKWGKFIVVGMIGFVVISQGWGQKEDKKVENIGTYIEGKMAGEGAARGSEMLLGVGAGCCLGPVGYIYPLVISGDPPYYMIEAMKDKSEEYKRGFYDGYNKKKQNAWTGTTVGCVLSGLSTLVYYIIVIAAAAGGGY